MVEKTVYNTKAKHTPRNTIGHCISETKLYILFGGCVHMGGRSLGRTIISSYWFSIGIMGLFFRLFVLAI